MEEFQFAEVGEKNSYNDFEVEIGRTFQPAYADYFCRSLLWGNLKRLDVDGAKCGFRLYDEDIGEVVQVIQFSDIQLESLSLKHHRMTGLSIKALSLLTSSSPFILHLDVEGNDINDLSTLQLESPSKCSLVSLNVSSNPLESQGGKQLADGIKTNNILLHLWANCCNFPLTAIIDIITSLHENHTLELLSIDRPLLSTTKEEEGTNHLSRVLLNNQTQPLKDISMKFHGIRDFGVRLLAESMSRNFQLISINLESNRIGVSGAEALASYLILQQRSFESNPSSSRNYLRSLGLSFNVIGDEGAIALSEALRVNKLLQNLSLKSNGIQPRGLLSLGSVLDHTRSLSLERLTLFGNDFDFESGLLFYELINERLKYFSFQLDIEVYLVDGEYMIAEKSSPSTTSSEMKY